MIDLLREHQETLNKLLNEIRTVEPERNGLKIAMDIYKMILEDGVEILGSLIVFLSKD